MPFSLEETFKAIARKMMVDFEGISTQLEHKGLRGRAREIAVVDEFLANYLPKQLGIATGEIVSSEGSVSKQMDIIIFDNFKSPIFLEEGEIRVLPVESVYAVIEVKSNLNREELEDSVEKIRSVKRLQKKAYVEQKGPIVHGTILFGREHPYFPTVGCCFAYDSISFLNIGKQLVEINREKAIPLEHRLDTICVLKQGVLTNWTAEKQKLSLTPDPDSRIVAIPTSASLLLFYLLLVGVLGQTRMRPLQLVEYVKGLDFGPAIYCE